MTRIAIIGCGNIGFRHLEAAVASSVDEIWVVEPRQDQLQQCLAHIGDPRVMGFNSIPTLLQRGQEFTVIISAVTADMQLRVIEQLQGAKTDALVLEKPVAAGPHALSDLLSLLEDHPERAVYVNCPRAMWSGYQRAKALLDKITSTFHLEISGNLWGFACNAIHFIELFRFLTHANTAQAVSAQLLPSPVAHKRGHQFDEFIGTAGFSSENGDILQLTCGYAHEAATPVIVTVRDLQSGELVALADESKDRIWLRDRHGFDAYPLGVLFVSQSGRIFLDDLLACRTPALPRLAAERGSHEALFKCLTMATRREDFSIT